MCIFWLQNYLNPFLMKINEGLHLLKVHVRQILWLLQNALNVDLSFFKIIKIFYYLECQEMTQYKLKTFFFKKFLEIEENDTIWITPVLRNYLWNFIWTIRLRKHSPKTKSLINFPIFRHQKTIFEVYNFGLDWLYSLAF